MVAQRRDLYHMLHGKLCSRVADGGLVVELVEGLVEGLAVTLLLRLSFTSFWLQQLDSSGGYASCYILRCGPVVPFVCQTSYTCYFVVPYSPFIGVALKNSFVGFRFSIFVCAGTKQYRAP